jgi:hypothetical protein
VHTPGWSVALPVDTDDEMALLYAPDPCGGAPCCLPVIELSLWDSMSLGDNLLASGDMLITSLIAAAAQHVIDGTCLQSFPPVSRFKVRQLRFVLRCSI